ncbi:hypothetical protein KJ877_01265 [bacterium]|nr:hypothetical protein [bacterium]MBU1989892.1 hypothetical protein [bacterium]
MIYNLKEYFSYTVKDKNLLVYSNISFKESEHVLNGFKKYTCINITSVSIDELKTYVIANNIDVLLVDMDEHAAQIYEIVKSLNTKNKKIHIVLHINFNCQKPYPPLINISEGVIAAPFDDNTLMYKFFTALSYESAMNTLANSKHSMKNIKHDSCELIDDYLDTYEGQILFLSESLQEYVISLDSGDLSQELIISISEKMKEVSKVFASHFYTKNVSIIFMNFSSYLKNLDLSSVDIENIEAFEYLARIVEDINSYLVEYFVDRVFSEIYIFEDSLRNSMEFMQDRLECNSDTKSKLEFF